MTEIVNFDIPVNITYVSSGGNLYTTGLTMKGIYEKKLPLEPGLYDINDNMVIGWSELTDTNSANYCIEADSTTVYRTLYKNNVKILSSKIASGEFVSEAGLPGVKLVIPASVKYLGNGSGFYKESSLEIIDFEVGSKLESVEGSNFFEYCYNLKEIHFPSSLYNIAGSYMFRNGSPELTIDLSKMSSLNNNLNFFQYAFSYANCKVLLPSDALSHGYCLNQASFRWSKIPEIVITSKLRGNIGQEEFEYSSLKKVTIEKNEYQEYFNISNWAFRYCTALEEVVINADIRYIETEAFYGCTALKTVTFNGDLKRIDKSAFSNCRNLELTIPDSVTSIGSNAFYGVKHIYYHGTATGAPWGALAIN